MADETSTTEPTAQDQIESLAAESTQTGEHIMVRDESFGLAASLPAIVMLRLTAAGDSKTAPAKQMSAIIQFLHHAIVPADRDRFETLLEDAEPVIDFEELNTILERVTEVISARPTGQP